MKIIALITARGGSKRLPGKNVRLLGGKLQIVWSIDVVKDIQEICDIIVSTDDPAIAAACAEAGANVPWLCPAELSTDKASSVDVALNALDWYEAAKGPLDGLLLLQPTSPFRAQSTVLKGIELFARNGQEPVLGVSETHAYPMWSLNMECGFLAPFMKEHGLGMRSQDLPPAYFVNGSFYLIAPRDLRQFEAFYIESTVPLVIDALEECIDIDTKWVWKMAEAVLKLKESY